MLSSLKDTRQVAGEHYTMPIVVRARSFYLYDRYGLRYIDFFQNHGRAILGHRPELLQRSLKSTANQGLISEYPSVFEGRLEKLLARLFPDYADFRLYADAQVVRQVILKVSSDPIYDPACSPPTDHHPVSFWRPYLEVGGADSELLLPILPFPGSFIPQVVCIKEQSLADEMPPSDPVSPLLLDLLIKTVATLIRSLESEEAVAKRKINPLAGLFETRGPYGMTHLSSSRYREFSQEALRLKVVLPPSVESPFITPGEYSKGDIALFLKLAEQYALSNG